MASMHLWSLFVFATCFFGAFADPVIKDPIAFKNATWEKCQKQENVPEDVMKDFYLLTSTDSLKDYKCVVKCVQEEYGFFKKDGTLKMVWIGKIIKDLWKDPQVHQQLIAVMEECKNSDPQGSQKCQKNFHLLDCFIRGAKKRKIDISNRKN